jgi:hypothetical protein
LWALITYFLVFDGNSFFFNVRQPIDSKKHSTKSVGTKHQQKTVENF